MNLFSTPFLTADLANSKDINIRLEKFAYDLKAKDAGVVKSNRGGYQTPLLDDSELMTEFFTMIHPLFAEFTTSLNISKVGVMAAWLNVNGQHSYNVEHCHSDCDLAGVYYVKAKKNSGRLYMNNPIPQAFMNLSMRRTGNGVYTQSLNFEAQEGRLFIFPGWLFHGVEANLSGEDRISIAFNLQAQEFDQ